MGVDVYASLVDWEELVRANRTAKSTEALLTAEDSPFVHRHEVTWQDTYDAANEASECYDGLRGDLTPEQRHAADAAFEPFFWEPEDDFDDDGDDDGDFDDEDLEDDFGDGDLDDGDLDDSDEDLADGEDLEQEDPEGGLPQDSASVHEELPFKGERLHVGTLLSPAAAAAAADAWERVDLEALRQAGSQYGADDGFWQDWFESPDEFIEYLTQWRDLAAAAKAQGRGIVLTTG